ncbi:MAG TPA: response regulator [Syntrophorhabdaceae bacterium]|nr:response regulator [Syntrophorhabdaceae bacterium]
MARILIVDDERISVLLAIRLLERLGHTVVDAVSTGKDAIERTAASNPDVILMDVGLKGDMDGIEAAKQINRLFSIPIIFVTAYTDQGTAKRMNETRFSGLISKPFQEEDLLRAVGEVLR